LIKPINNFAPLGISQISKNFEEGFIAVVPQNKDGISPVVKSSIESQNYKRMADSLHFLLDRSIDSIKFENDSISVYYHRKTTGRIRLGDAIISVDTLTASSGSYIDVSFDLPTTNIENELEVIRDGFSCSYLRDYTIGLDGAGDRRRITFVIDLLYEFVRVNLRL
jgi:hypothetical protein